MNIIRPVCCGMDVHKNIIVATIGTSNMETGVTEYIQETFTTLNPDLFRLKQWLVDHECYDACMESTGKYWIPVYNVLEDKINICLTHPKYVKAIKGKKTDKKDSKWICELFKHDLVRSSFIPPKAIRALREISRYRIKLIGMRTSERNRYQNCMTVSNLGIGSVFSDPFGKSAKAVMTEVLSSEVIDDEKILKLVSNKCKNKDKILDAIKNSNIESEQRFKMDEAMTHLDELQVHINNCEVEMVKRVAPMLDQFMHITDLDGITFLSAIMIVAEIGVDMTQFETDAQLVNWAGLAPANNESANKKKSVRISKAGQYLKPLLVQCALAATKCKDGYFAVKYARIKKRRGHKKAIIAVARMMLIAIYHMILTGETFNPCDIDTFRNPNPVNKPSMTEEAAIEYLKNLGYNVSDLSK